MIKRIPCTVVSSAFSGNYGQKHSRQPPIQPGDSSGPLGKVSVDDDIESFPMGMFVDVIIGD